jgi:ABC-type siderophore export system fused ATPase/permease subunit
MPQFPIVVPVIILGLTLGSLLRGRSSKISKKKFAYATLSAGLLNVAYAYAFLQLFPYSPPTTTFGRSFAVAQISEPVFLIASFLVAVILVAAVLGIAQIYSRARGGYESEEAVQLDSTAEEQKLTSG